MPILSVSRAEWIGDHLRDPNVRIAEVDYDPKLTTG